MKSKPKGKKQTLEETAARGRVLLEGKGGEIDKSAQQQLQRECFLVKRGREEMQQPEQRKVIGGVLSG